MDASVSRLGFWDYVSMSAVVVAASSVGLYHSFAASRQKNAREFLVASRDLGVVPLILSTVASYVSAVGILGFPVETYSSGAVFLPHALASITIIPVAVYLFLPIFFNLGTSTIFEYLEFRFSRSMRLSSSILLSVQLVLYTSCVIYAPALALNQVTGLHVWASVVSIGVICIIYTSMGGLKAVVWADVAQMVVMMSVVAAIVLKATWDVGGLAAVWRYARDNNRGRVLLWTPSPHSLYTTWTVVVGGTWHVMGGLVINQVMMQRYLSNKSLRNATISLVGGCVGVAIMTLFTTFAGLVAYARYRDCDPLLSGLITSRDQLMALFGIESLTFCRGLAGVFVGAILCATLSTLSSTLNSLTAMTMEDYVRPLRPHLSDADAMKLSKALGIFYGTLCVVLVAFAESIGGIIKAVFSVAGMTTGPVLALFTVGMLFPWVTTTGAAAGFFTSIAFNAWACFGSLLTNPPAPSAGFSTAGCNVTSAMTLSNVTAAAVGDAGFLPSASDGVFALYTLAPLWYSVWSLAISTVVALGVSVVLGCQNPEELDPRLVSPLARNLCELLLPDEWRNRVGFPRLRKPTKSILEPHDSEVPLKLASVDDDDDDTAMKRVESLPDPSSE